MALISVKILQSKTELNLNTKATELCDSTVLYTALYFTQHI